MSKRKIIKVIITVIVLGLLIYYIASGIFENIDKIRDVQIQLNGLYIFLSIVCIFGFDLLVLVAWRYLINLDECGHRLSFCEAFGIYYFTAILKYLPGKVWSYMLQIKMMEKRGYQLSKLIFDNIFLLIFTVSTPFLIGIEYYLLNIFPLTNDIKILLSCLLLILYIFALIIFPSCFVPLIQFLNRFLKHDIQYKKIRFKDVAFIQIIMFIAYGIYILAGSFVSLGVGFTGHFGEAMEIGIICTIAMIIGFIVLIMPGGLGVQESIIFSQVGNRFGMGISFITSIAFRLVVILENILSTLLSIPFVYSDLRSILSENGEKILESETREIQHDNPDDI